MGSTDTLARTSTTFSPASGRAGEFVDLGPIAQSNNPTAAGNTDLGKGEVQGFGPDGKVYKTQLIMRVYDGSGALRYYANGKALPPSIVSEIDAKTYVRQQIGKGTLGLLELGNQQAFSNQKAPTVPSTPVGAIGNIPNLPNKDSAIGGVRGQGPDGKMYKGELIQRLYGTGQVRYYFKGIGVSHPLPQSISSSREAADYIHAQISSGTWKDLVPTTKIDNKLENIADGNGKIREFVNGEITTTELKEKRIFSGGRWINDGFVAQGVQRYSSNPLMGGVYNRQAQGYFLSSSPTKEKIITAPNGAVIKDINEARTRVKELINQGVFMPNKSVAQMSASEKLDYVLGVALNNATPAVAAELKALFTPENMVKMAILGGVQFIPGVGIAADVVVGICVGQQAIDVGIKYFNAIHTALNASTKAELDTSGVAIAQATAQLGVGVGTTLVGAGIAKGIRKVTQNKPTSTPAAGEATNAPGAPTVKPTKALKTPNLGATLKAAQTTTDNLVTAGTLGGLAYLKAKFDRGEVAIGYADKLPGMKNAVTTIFNDASANNSVADAQRQIVVYTTKPGSKDADGYFLANVNASVLSSKIFNIGNITSDMQSGKMHPTSWFDLGKINLIAQNLAAKDQTGAGVRATVGSALSINAGIYFGIPEINTRLKASINLMSINGTLRAMSIGPYGKKQDKASTVEVAKALVQGYFNFYGSIPSKDAVTGKRTGQSPQVGGMQFQINKQLGLPGGFALNISDVQPSKKEWNIFFGAKTADGNNKRIVGETYPKGKATSTSAFNLLFNGNKNTNLSLGDVVSAPFSSDGKATGEIGKQLSGFSEAMRHAFLDAYPVGSPGYMREKQLRENSKNGTLSPF